MKKITAYIRERMEDKLRCLCAFLSPENRLVIVLLFLLLGAVLNIYFMFSTIRNWGSGKTNGSSRIEHIEAAEIEARKRRSFEKPENTYDYEEEEEEFDEEAR